VGNYGFPYSIYQNVTSAGRFEKLLKRPFRRVKGENWVISFEECVILHLSFQNK